MHLHILGVCGTFMAGIAALARALGHRVTGSDANAYPPMSEQLSALGIEVRRGYAAEHLDPPPDLLIVGNALSRANAAVEAMLNRRLRFASGPAWLYQQVLRERTVLAVAGTHGKTSTASMLAWIFEYAGLNPGFLIGGVPQNFGISARLGQGPFVVEADEYDSAFFDKRSKFVHYYPQGLIINNIEFDHADIFDSLADIRRQFHHLIRTVPGNGRIVINTPDAQIEQVLAMGVWTPVERCEVGEAGQGGWQAIAQSEDYQRFTVSDGGAARHRVTWRLLGEHNARNALAAIALAAAFGVAPALACRAMQDFAGVRRRFEIIGVFGGVTMYDDFAHHPTAIAATVQTLRSKIGSARILAVVDLASNTMRAGVHHNVLGASLKAADLAWIYQRPDSGLSVPPLGDAAPQLRVADKASALVASVAEKARRGDHLLIMSNASIVELKQRLIEALEPPAR